MKISILALAAATVADAAASSSERNERTAKKVSIGENDIPGPAQLRVLVADASSEEESHSAIALKHLADMTHLHEASESYSDEREDPSDQNRRYGQRRIEKRDKNEKRKRLGGKRLKVSYFLIMKVIGIRIPSMHDFKIPSLLIIRNHTNNAYDPATVYSVVL